MKTIVQRCRPIVLAGVLLSLALVTKAEATPLVPDSFASAELRGGFDPGELIASSISPFVTATESVTGLLRTAVYRNSSGLLDFYYQVVNSAASSTGVSRLTATSFGGFLTDVAYRTDAFGIFSASTIGPQTVDRSLDGSTIGFGFGFTSATKVNPTQTSGTMMISTNATDYYAGMVNIINGSVGHVDGYGAQEVPEPATAALLFMGIAGLAGVRRKLTV